MEHENQIDDGEAIESFRGCTAGQAKRLGRQVPVRADWGQVKVEVMRGLLEQKFAEGSALGELLTDTGRRRLVEGNQWGDRFWGVCRGQGENRLGRLLEDQREFLQKRAAARPENGSNDRRDSLPGEPSEWSRLSIPRLPVRVLVLVLAPGYRQAR